MFRLGWGLIRNNRRTEGIDKLKQALLIEPKDVEVLTKLGEIMLRGSQGNEDQLKEAQGYLERAVAIDPAIPDALVALGRVYEKQGNIESAKE